MAERILCSAETCVSAIDERGSGHANHVYKVYDNKSGDELLMVEFQRGAIQENGVNGVQNEDLLMMVIDRLIGFQTGEFACSENEEALRLIIQGTSILQLRTAKRKARGVEGKNVK
jgi:hypothetical protein